MSDTPNNHKTQDQIVEGMPDLENSTIFSDPVAYGTNNNKKKNHWSRRITAVVAVVMVAVLVVVGWFAVGKFLPEPDTGNSSSATPSGTGELIATAELEKVKSMTVTALDKSIVLQNVDALSEDERPNTEEKWIINGYDSSIISGKIVSYRVEDACKLTAIRTLAKGPDYGLDKPTKTIKVELIAGGGFTITVGKESPDKVGYYCAVDTKPDQVYLVEASALSLIEADPLHYVEKTVISPLTSTDVGNAYFQGEGSALNMFSSISVKGAAIRGEISLGMTEDKTKYNLYSLTSPIKAFADETKVLELLGPVSQGLTVSSAVSLDFEADKSKYGLDNPAYIAEYKVGNYEETIQVSSANGDGVCYLAVGQKPLAIYQVYASDLPFQGLDVTGLYTPYPFFENVTTVDNISISGPAGDYNFSLTHIADEDDNTKNLKVVGNGKEIDVPSFRYFYQHLVKLSAISFTDEVNSASADVTIRVKFNGEGAEDTVLTLSKLSDLRYYLAVNGSPYGIVAAADVDGIFNDCATLISGGKIEA